MKANHLKFGDSKKRKFDTIKNSEDKKDEPQKKRMKFEKNKNSDNNEKKSSVKIPAKKNEEKKKQNKEIIMELANLPFDCSENEVRAFLVEKRVKISSIIFPTFAENGKSVGYCFLKFLDQEGKNFAEKESQGENFKMKGRKLRLSEPIGWITVTNVSKDLTDNDIKSKFDLHGKITNFVRYKDQDTVQIEYENFGDAENATASLRNTKLNNKTGPICIRRGKKEISFAAYVGRFSGKHTEQQKKEITKIFSDLGPIKRVQKGNCFYYVFFNDEGALKKALDLKKVTLESGEILRIERKGEFNNTDGESSQEKRDNREDYEDSNLEYSNSKGSSLMMEKNQKRERKGKRKTWSLFVGNLAENTTQIDLENVFKDCEDFKGVVLKNSDPETSKKMFAFVDFLSQKGLEQGFALNQTNLNGRSLNIQLRKSD